MNIPNSSILDRIFQFLTKGLFDRRVSCNMEDKSFIKWQTGGMLAEVIFFAAVTIIGSTGSFSLNLITACCVLVTVGVFAYNAGISTREITSADTLILIGMALPYGMILERYDQIIPGLIPFLASIIAFVIISFVEPQSRYNVWRLFPANVFWPIFGIACSIATCWLTKQQPLVWIISCIATGYILGVYGSALHSTPREETIADVLGATMLLPIYALAIIAWQVIKLTKAITSLITWPFCAGLYWVFNIKPQLGTTT